MIDGEFVNAIVDVAKEAAETIHTQEIGGRIYSLEELRRIDPPKEPLPDPLVVHTLSGLVDYIKSDLDRLAMVHASAEEPISEPVTTYPGIAVHVIDEKTVQVISQIVDEDYYQRRVVHAVASLFPRGEQPFGQLIDVERAVVWLQTAFEPSPDRERVLAIIGNLSDTTTVKVADDGVTQNVLVQTGIVRVGEVAAPNPVTLIPLRTFPEIEQPGSPYCLRIKKGEGAPRIALFQADGDEWRTTAVERIAVWLRYELPDGVNVIA